MVMSSEHHHTTIMYSHEPWEWHRMVYSARGIHEAYKLFPHFIYTFRRLPLFAILCFFSYLLQLHRKRWHPLVSFHLKFNQMNHGVDGSFWVEQCNATQCHRTWKCRGQKLCSLFDFRVTQKLIDREKWHV